jgi:purine-nucleoside phosphorylase
MSIIATPHINADTADIADTVLMPGDPLRSKFIAENFLSDPVLINNVRGVQGYTGTYNGKKVTVMASGMGMPSIGIYSYELFNFTDVRTIIRIGSAGGLADGVQLRDIVIGVSACYDSVFMDQYQLPGTFAPTADFSLASQAAMQCEKLGLRYKAGSVVSTDVFYDARSDALAKWKSMGVLAVEMESAALYANAAIAGKKALCVCTISDLPLSGEACSAEERQTSFTGMMKLALEIA